ncbi:MAG: hypothetical protein GF329_15215 [Candidatus Lokiarchaeota archaeon]|nr:hypothetical protein [Candidatus Lokiarchaeota archaeon]
MRILLIILDGCPINSLEHSSTEFFDQIIEKGNGTYNCKAIFPTATYTGHTSIITGCYPNRTGMIGNQYYDRKEKISKHFDNFNPNKHIEAKTIFEYLQEFLTVSICEPVYKGANEVKTMKEIYKNSIDKRNEIIYRKALKSIKNKENDFYMINFSSIDSIGEIYGPDSIEFHEEVKRVDSYIKDIYNKSVSLRDTTLFITSDHGLTNIKYRYDLSKDLLDNGFEVICLPSHRIAHIYIRKENREDLRSYLSQNDRIKYIIESDEFSALKINHDRCGDMIAVAEDHVEFEVENLKGSHGGLSIEEINVPLFIIGLESSKYNFDLRDCKIIDILPTILEILDIKTKDKMDGKSLLSTKTN